MACLGEVDGKEEDLRTVIDHDCQLNILTAKDEKGLAALRHTASHVMAQAVNAFIRRQNLRLDHPSQTVSTMMSIRLPL